MDVVLTHSMQTRLGVDLCRGNPLVPEKLLHLVQGHACIQQDGRDAGAETMRSDVPIDSRPLRCCRVA